MKETTWNETVIVVQADYADYVTFDLTVNFERMLDRRIPPADLAQWLVCVALDGGLKPGNNTVNAIFIYPEEKTGLENFTPSDFRKEIDGQAFRDPQMGEFLMNALHSERMLKDEEFFCQVLETLCDAAEIKHLVVVADMIRFGADLRALTAKTDGKDITLLTMEPVCGKGFRSEILGYSLMNALGITADQLDNSLSR